MDTKCPAEPLLANETRGNQLDGNPAWTIGVDSETNTAAIFRTSETAPMRSDLGDNGLPLLQPTVVEVTFPYRAASRTEFHSLSNQRQQVLVSNTLGTTSLGISMPIKSKPRCFHDHPTAPLLIAGFALCVVVFSGCQDGPLYGLKVANPYFTMKEWKQDEELGVTDHERWQQLAELSETIDRLPADRQQFWSNQLQSILDNDNSAEMRRLVVQAAGNLDGPSAMAMIEQGLDDPSMKVRMEACRSLGKKQNDQATRLLVSTLGTDTSEDVKHSAMSALGAHKNQISIDSLRLALQDRDPATRNLAIEALRGATGKNYGDNPEVWIAALDGKPIEETQVRFADRLWNLF